MTEALVSGDLLVLGAGTMGAQIALQGALCGVGVRLVDSAGAQLERAGAECRRLLDRRIEKGDLDGDAAAASLARLRMGSDLDEAAAGVGWAIEAISEDEAAKRAVFAALDAALPAHAGIATNSSNIVVSRIAGATSRPQLCCNMHFFHPVTRMDIVEIAGGAATAEETLDRAEAWARRIGRLPVRIHGEVDGFVVNRILGVASGEAFAMLDEGVAGVEAIDTAARAGLNWRMGPFQLADFSGLDVVRDIRRDRYERQGAPRDLATVRVLDRMVAAGRLGRKSGRGFYDYSTDPPAPLPLP